MGPPRFELESLAPKAVFNRRKSKIKSEQLDEFMAFREIEGLCDEWIELTRQFIHQYLDFVNWGIDKKNTLEYLNKVRLEHSTTYYRKIAYQIRKFLTYLDVDWAKDIKPPSEPIYLPKRVTLEDIKDTLSYFKDNQYFLQIKVLIFLGISSGMRAEELYQLTIDDIDLDNRIIHINHNPQNGQSTKTKISRISFFNKEAQIAMNEYLTYFKSDVNLKVLFSQSHITRLFRNAPLQVKDLRKFFSQEWGRRGGPTSIKKILMGHSLKGDVDLMHYNYQSEEDLKKIYDKVMGGKLV
ncbi:MAG: site-specific integrase [Thermoplasmatales archaeon]|nr:site-specific integrase [Thermoplasmatales archaeon]